MTIFDLINSIYTKTYIEPETNTFLNLTISKWLSYDKYNLQVLKQIFPLIFYVTPTHYYYLLWLNIPKKFRAPFLKKIEEVEYEPPILFQKIKEYFGWSNREFMLNRKLLEKVILPNQEHWLERLGIDG